MEYFVIPFDESLEDSGYHNCLTFSLDKWLKKPHASFEDACQVANNLANQAFHDGRLITTFAVVERDGWDIHHFQDSYKTVYKTACNEQAEKAYWSGSNQTSVWFCPEEDILNSIPHDEKITFEDWFNGLQNVKKNGRCHDRVAFFKDAASAQASDFRNDAEKHQYVWHVGGKTFPSYGDAVIFVLESEELNFDDITMETKENVAA